MRFSISSVGPAVDRALLRFHVVCDSHSCGSRQILRSFPGSRRGIQAGQRWYCSVECFVRASQATLFALWGQPVVDMPRNPRLSLGLVMLSRGYLSKEQLRTASDQSQGCSESLDSTLVRLGMATEKQIAAARSAQWGYPVLAREHMDQNVQSDIPQSILQSCSAVPLHYSQAARRIMLGFVHRIEHSLLRSIERMTGCRAEPCFITATDLAEQTKRLTWIGGYHEVLIDNPGSPEKMGCALGRAALEVSAEEAEFTECKDHIWVRLTGKRELTDVIFRLRSTAARTTENPGNYSEAVSSLV
jgi:hypothetical protein